jgi:ATP-dependent helicase/nuclease subunit A
MKDTLDKEIITINWDNSTTRKSLFTTYRLLRLFGCLYSQWVQYKRQQGVVDFDDLINLTHFFLTENAEVCKEIADGIKYIFIDEFQDTDRKQVQLIHLLLEANPDISLFFVGDAKQSIYAFRNAEVKVFHEQRKLVSKDDLFLLDFNFRSAKEILEFINTFFKTTNYLSDVEEEYRCMKHQRSGYNEPRVEFLLSTPLDMDKKTLKEDDIDIEAKVIADRIQSLVEGENPLKIIEEEKERPATYGDFTLLFCTKNYIYKYEKALKDNGIPCYVVSSRGFFEITEVKDIMDFLHVLLNPYHDVSLLAFLRGPFCGLSDEQIVRWQMQIPLRKMLIELATIPEPLLQDPSYSRVRTLYQKFLKKANMPIHELVDSIINETGYKAILLGQWFGKQKIANLQSFYP